MKVSSLALAAVILASIAGLGASATLPVAKNNPSCNTTGIPAYCNIQAALDNAANGDTVLVSDGVYEENLNLNGLSNFILESQNGRASTTIKGVSGVGALGTIFIPQSPTVSNLVICGFTILGIDNNIPAVENAAIYLQKNAASTHQQITIDSNEVVAMGDSGITFEYNARVEGVTIINNIFSGQTFVGAVPGGCGFSLQFSVINVPRQLVVIGGGGGVTNTKSVDFLNNQITGTAGAVASGCPSGHQGNTLVTIDTVGANINGNTFTGQTSRYVSALRARGTDTTISNNMFSSAGLLPFACHLYIDSIGGGLGDPSVSDVAALNTFDTLLSFSGTPDAATGSTCPLTACSTYADCAFCTLFSCQCLSTKKAKASKKSGGAVIQLSGKSLKAEKSLKQSKKSKKGATTFCMIPTMDGSACDFDGQCILGACATQVCACVSNVCTVE